MPKTNLPETPSSQEPTGDPRVMAALAKLAQKQDEEIDWAYPSERARIRQALREAGILAELGLEAQKLAERGKHVRPEDVEQAFARAGGKPLSEILLEQRGKKT